jgi:hypothetical protein
MVTFTWAHALMDAKSAEYFLAVAGGEEMPELRPGEDWYSKRAALAGGWRARARQAWSELNRLDQFQNTLPVSLGTQRHPVTRTMKIQAVALSVEESVRVRSHAARLCGFLGDTNFHMAVTLVELHRLHERIGCPSLFQPNHDDAAPVSARRAGHDGTSGHCRQNEERGLLA